jgi:hypothetical protein
MIEVLVQEVPRQEEQIGQLKDAIAVLEGEKKRPRFKLSKWHEKAGKNKQDPKADGSKPTKRPSSRRVSMRSSPPAHVTKPKTICSEGNSSAGRIAAGLGASPDRALAPQWGAKRSARPRQEAPHQHWHAKRSGPMQLGYVREFEENVPKTRVSFWSFVTDRVTGTNTFRPLPALIQVRVASA